VGEVLLPLRGIRISPRGPDAAKTAQVRVLPGPPGSVVGEVLLPLRGIRISPRGSDAAKTAQVRVLPGPPESMPCRGRGPSPAARDQDFASRLRRRENGSSSSPTGPTRKYAVSWRRSFSRYAGSGFRLAARTPRKRLKFESCRAHQSYRIHCPRFVVVHALNLVAGGKHAAAFGCGEGLALARIHERGAGRQRAAVEA
jgi:hypothetical protein